MRSRITLFITTALLAGAATAGAATASLSETGAVTAGNRYAAANPPKTLTKIIFVATGCQGGQKTATEWACNVGWVQDGYAVACNQNVTVSLHGTVTSVRATSPVACVNVAGGS